MVTIITVWLYYHRNVTDIRHPVLSNIMVKGLDRPKSSNICLDSSDCTEDRLCYNNYCIPRPITMNQRLSSGYNNKNITLNRHLLYLIHSVKRFSIFPSLWSLPRVIDVIDCPETKFGIIVLTDTGIYYVPNFTDNQCQPVHIGINDGGITQLFWYRGYLCCVNNYKIYQGPNLTRIKSRDFIDRWDCIDYINGKDIRGLRIKMVSVPILGLQDTIWIASESTDHVIKYGLEDHMYLTITNTGRLRLYINNNLVYQINNVIDAVINPIIDDEKSDWSLVILSRFGILRLIYSNGEDIVIDTGYNISTMKSTRDIVWLISKDLIISI